MDVDLLDNSGRDEIEDDSCDWLLDRIGWNRVVELPSWTVVSSSFLLVY
jgi:hypothetical protein